MWQRQERACLHRVEGRKRTYSSKLSSYPSLGPIYTNTGGGEGGKGKKRRVKALQWGVGGGGTFGLGIGLSIRALSVCIHTHLDSLLTDTKCVGACVCGVCVFV